METLPRPPRPALGSSHGAVGSPRGARRQKLPGAASNPARPPRGVRQFGGYSCWAAALESWLDAAESPATHLTQAELVALFPDQARAGFTNKELRQVLASLGMDTFWMPFGKFDAPNIKDTLNKRGPLYVGTQVLAVYWHAVVLFSVEEHAGQEPRYWVMNPGTGNLEPWVEHDFFRRGPNHDLIVGFKSVGAHGRVR